MGANQCEVCKEVQSKYKCPSCLIPYCSLVCYKKHKEIPCKPSMPSESAVPATPAATAVPAAPAAPAVEEPCNLSKTEAPGRSLEVDDESCMLSNELLQSIAESEEIRGLLKDDALQSLIKKIDSSQNPDCELDVANESDAFRQLTDKILSAINPQK